MSVTGKRKAPEGNSLTPCVHYNINGTNNTRLPVELAVIQKAGPILGNHTKEYCVAVERLSISGATIPYLIMNDGEYVVTIESATPAPNNKNSQALVYNALDERYGKNTVFSYTQIAEAVNAALLLAFNAITKPVGIVDPPQFMFNKQTGTFALLLPLNYDDTNMKVYFNTKLYVLFDNFHHLYRASNIGYEYQLLMDRADETNLSSKNTGGTNLIAPEDYVYIQQEFENLAALQQFVAVVFRSSKLGLQAEYGAGANNSDDLVVNVGAGAPSSTMITDLLPYLGGGDKAAMRGYLYYAPSNFRWIPLQIDLIDDIDISIFIRDKQGNEIPYFIPPYQMASLKLIFAHRDFIQM